MENIVNSKTHSIQLQDVRLQGDLALPEHAGGIVLFAHGSGSSRLSPRNREVAAYLNKLGIATLLVDLLTKEEDDNYGNRFDIPLLADRLWQITKWIQSRPECAEMRVGYFGASTGSAAALVAAANAPVTAIVSRGGRPDLAMHVLGNIKAPTLLIVGAEDRDVLKLNELAYEKLNCQKKMEIIPDATHLFEEEGAMEKVAILAGNWFELFLQPLELHQ